MGLNRLLQLLPEELIIYIISYTYSPQTLKLTNDIRNFVASNNILQELYYERWMHTFEYEENANQNWIDNDLIGYMNQGQATMHGYRKNFYDIIARNYFVNEKMHKNFSRSIRHSNSVKRTNSLLWGLFTIEERNDFLEKQTN